VPAIKIIIIKLKNSTMEDSPLNRKISKMLHDFESIENIQPSREWNKSLMDKLGCTKPASASKLPSTGIAFAFLLFVLINLGFVVNTMLNGSNLGNSSDKDLLVISKEFLINPISLNN
jgi:hypothetical protein